MFNTIPGTVMHCVETYYKGTSFDGLSSGRKQIIRELMAYYCEMPIDDAINTFRLHSPHKSRKPDHSVNFEKEYTHLKIIIDTVLYPDKEDY